MPHSKLLSPDNRQRCRLTAASLLFPIKSITLTAIGGIVIALGLFSDYFRRNWWTSDPLAALALGIVLGPLALGLINPTQWGLT